MKPTSAHKYRIGKNYMAITVVCISFCLMSATCRKKHAPCEAYTYANPHLKTKDGKAMTASAAEYRASNSQVQPAE